MHRPIGDIEPPTFPDSGPVLQSTDDDWRVRIHVDCAMRQM